tara:strand:- start:956 stop:1396 length:441 start_codon:yes stop_codon:yes gene_type:complete
MVDDNEVITVVSEQGQTVELVSVEEWIENIDSLAASGKGVLIKPADDVTLLKDSLNKIALIALDFIGFDEGRGYSQAALIRNRWGYSGEIRGINTHLDQLQFMLRSGVSTYDLQEQYQGSNEHDYTHGFSICYQAAANNTDMKEKF